MDFEKELQDTHRSLLLFGDVDEDWYLDLRKRTLELLYSSNEPINLLIDSRGGSVRFGYYAHDWLTALPCAVHTYAVGQCYSSGFDIFLAGERRLALPHSLFLIHNIGMNIDGLSASRTQFEARLQERLDGVMRLTHQTTMLYASKSSLKEDEIRTVMDESDDVHRYYDPAKMLEWGFVTEIVTKLPWNTSAF